MNGEIPVVYVDQDISCIDDSVTKTACSLTQQCDQKSLCPDKAVTKNGDWNLNIAMYFYRFKYHYEVRYKSHGP